MNLSTSNPPRIKKSSKICKCGRETIDKVVTIPAHLICMCSVSPPEEKYPRGNLNRLKRSLPGASSGLKLNIIESHKFNHQN